MSDPILTAEQRTGLFEEATLIVSDTTFMFDLSDPDHPERRESFSQDVRELRDAISVLDCIGWHPDEQSEPLTELKGNLEDHEALDRFAANMEAKWQESVDDYERDVAHPRQMVGTARAMKAALHA